MFVTNLVSENVCFNKSSFWKCTSVTNLVSENARLWQIKFLKMYICDKSSFIFRFTVTWCTHHFTNKTKTRKKTACSVTSHIYNMLEYIWQKNDTYLNINFHGDIFIYLTYWTSEKGIVTMYNIYNYFNLDIEQFGGCINAMEKGAFYFFVLFKRNFIVYIQELVQKWIIIMHIWWNRISSITVFKYNNYVCWQ